LSIGVGYELSPIDNKVRSFRLPDNDQWWLSAGLSYRIDESTSLQFAYSLVLPKSTEVLAAGAGGPAPNGPFSGDADSQFHVITAGLSMRFD